MDYGAARSALAEGDFVRRAVWQAGSYICPMSEDHKESLWNLEYHCGEEVTPFMNTPSCVDDMSANDWEVLE